MRKSRSAARARTYFRNEWTYTCCRWTDFDYSVLNLIRFEKRAGRGISKYTYNDVFVMGDTETSKSGVNQTYYDVHGRLRYIPVENYVVAWTISIRAYDRNICTLWGQRPSDMMRCISNIIDNMDGDRTVIYFHNLAYDWTFLRKFFFSAYGEPVKQLNTKAHYPLYIEFENGIMLKDSLILAQRSLDKWGKDLNVEHQKAVGYWDYDKIRTQESVLTPEEIEYIEHDTLCGVECLDSTRHTLRKRVYSMPWTATGIPREEVLKRGSAEQWKRQFKKQALTYDQYRIFEKVYHGGYTHGNRHIIEDTITGDIVPFDFASSYPFVLLSEKYPGEKFFPIENCSIQEILQHSETHAFVFRLVLIGVRLSDPDWPMPALQYSKCIKTINPILDNGRLLAADYVELFTNEVDAEIFAQQYTYKKHICMDVLTARKKYLPKWLTDYIYECFREKTMLKGGDPVKYAIAKAKVNSIYGLTVMHSVRDDIREDYVTGEYTINEDMDFEQEYEKYLKNFRHILNYQIGVYCTSYAFRNLFRLGSCAGTWLYSDTDSCYGLDWDREAVNEYNRLCKEKLQANGYGPVIRNDREYWLGIAEEETHYTEFRCMGAKRYCGRTPDGDLHITVAGVPKKGVKCLDNDIEKFTKGFVFDGMTTGKKTHFYIYNDEIKIDPHGNEIGDSVDLCPCDYLLDSVPVYDSWQELLTQEVFIQVYEEQ